MSPVRNLSRNKTGKNINQGFVPRADRDQPLAGATIPGGKH